MGNPLQAIEDAEKEIESRNRARQSGGIDVPFRTIVAGEQVADELTRIRAELHTIRNLFATYAAVMQSRR